MTLIGNLAPTFAAEASGGQRNRATDPTGRIDTAAYFILAVLGFSFWFLMAVPFASHRETYSWLARAQTESLVHQLSFGVSSTYRPLSQVVTWLGFLILKPAIFPTSVLRQGLLQAFVYGMFVLGWWLIYSSAKQRRLFALIACVTGGVFFSGYIQLFHLYGMFYVPVILTLGALLKFYSANTFEKREAWFAGIATVLVLWHPFATALFLGFFFGFYLETFIQRSRSQHLRAIMIFLAGIAAIGFFVVLFPSNFPSSKMPLATKLLGFFVSYQTNEVNRFASLVAFLLAQTVVFSMDVSAKLKALGFFIVSALGLVFIIHSIPLLFIWIGAGLIKLIRLRRWSLFFLMLTAALLPFGGGIGSPMYGLFAIILAAYATAMDWSRAESALSLLKTRYVAGAITAALIVLLMVRMGIDVPIVTNAARPLLAERERTYQLENILAWLHGSEFCSDQVGFVAHAGSPVYDVESAITRKDRPPASLGDVQFFWDDVLRCPEGKDSKNSDQTAIITFGEAAVANASPVHEVRGKYASNAIVWISNKSVSGPPKPDSSTSPLVRHLRTLGNIE
jgi:hypothetical protein